jgi:glycoside/pentoside/hexuronide:cation symporter, GPH family
MVTPPQSDLSLLKKLQYGAGQVAESFGLNGIKQIGNLYYVVLLGINPLWVGSALAVVRLWDAVLDPFLGHISDRWTGRHGRRKPFLVIGVLIMAGIFPVFWIAQKEWGTRFNMIFFITVLLVFTCGYACFSVAYQAMGIELTRNHHERTTVQAFKTPFGQLSNLVLWWTLPLAFTPLFPDEYTGMLWIGAGVGLLILTGGLMPTLIKEQSIDVQANAKRIAGNPLQNWRTVISNQPFRLLLGTMGGTFIGINLTFGINNLLNVYYVYGGNVQASMIIIGTGGTFWTLSSLGAACYLPLLSKRFGKKQTLAGCILAIAAGSLLYLWVFDPEYPFLQLLPILVINPGVTGLWILSSSMLADVCDDDRLRHGEYREATFSAVYAMIKKIALSSSFAFSGLLTVWSGFKLDQAANQAPGVFDTMKAVLAFTPLLALVPAFILLIQFPITESVAQENASLLKDQLV